MVATTLRQKTHVPFEVLNMREADAEELQQHPSTPPHDFSRLLVGPACAVGPRKTSDVEVTQDSEELLDPTAALARPCVTDVAGRTAATATLNKSGP